MTFPEVMKALDELSLEELGRLREEIDLRTTQGDLHAGTMNVDALLRAASELTEGLSEAEIEVMIAAMNEEYVEPADDEAWRD
jgi:hypothetical protein